jgi:DNA-binding transcriptional ArsR family regulator
VTEREDGQLDSVLSAVADPTRRGLLTELAARGSATATGLAAGLPISRQAVVKHLAILSQAGLVAGRRQGREMRYVVRPAGLAATARQLAGLAAQWDRRLMQIRRIAESPPGGHDLHAERHQRDRDDLEVGDPQRDADDRDAE